VDPGDPLARGCERSLWEPLGAFQSLSRRAPTCTVSARLGLAAWGRGVVRPVGIAPRARERIVLCIQGTYLSTLYIDVLLFHSISIIRYTYLQRKVGVKCEYPVFALCTILDDLVPLEPKYDNATEADTCWVRTGSPPLLVIAHPH
jgi:hypothetical protein